MTPPDAVPPERDGVLLARDSIATERCQDWDGEGPCLMCRIEVDAVLTAMRGAGWTLTRHEDARCEYEFTTDGGPVTCGLRESAHGVGLLDGHPFTRQGDRERVLREFAEGVVRQWGYVSGGSISAGGLSTLEEAFDILGWDDPHPLDDGDPAVCDEPGCGEASSNGWPSPSGYRHTCHQHSDWHVRRKCKWPDDSDHWKGLAADDAGGAA